MRSGVVQAIVLAAITLLGVASAALAQADLAVTFSGGPNFSGCGGCGGGLYPIAPGGQALYELIVKNRGPATARR